MPKIHFINEGKTIEMKALKPLWKAKEEGIEFVKEPNCNGEGRCKKCTANINGQEKLTCTEKVYHEDLEIETLTYYKAAS